MAGSIAGLLWRAARLSDLAYGHTRTQGLYLVGNQAAHRSSIVVYSDGYVAKRRRHCHPGLLRRPRARLWAWLQRQSLAAQRHDVEAPRFAPPICGQVRVFGLRAVVRVTIHGPAPDRDCAGLDVLPEG